MSMGAIVGVAGVLAQGTGIVLQVVGIATKNPELESAGLYAGFAGGILSTASGMLVSHAAAQAARSQAALEGILAGGAAPGIAGRYTPRLSVVSPRGGPVASGASRANSIIPSAAARSGVRAPGVSKMTQTEQLLPAGGWRDVAVVHPPTPAPRSAAPGAHTLPETPPPLPPPSTHPLYRPSSPAPQPSASTVRQPSIRAQRLSIDRGEGAGNTGTWFTNSHGRSIPAAPHRYVPTNRHFGLINIYKP